jgi:DNA-binding GntR family transcriptional regulator
MRQLEAEGLLAFKPGKGAVISPLSLDEIREVVELRARLEPELVTKAVPNLTNRDFEEAAAILNQSESALKDGNVFTWGEFNWRFHATLCAPSGRTLTVGILQNLHNLNQRYARLQISLAKWGRRAAPEHRAILAARSPENILTTGEELLRFGQQHRETRETNTKVK